LAIYIDAALSQKYIIVTIARLLVPPVFMVLLAAETNWWIISLYGIVFGYLFSMGVVVSILMLAYLPARMSILLVERLLIRLIEIKDGPIYSVAALCAIVGISMKAIFY
jgi:hypothetical protein